MKSFMKTFWIVLVFGLSMGAAVLFVVFSASNERGEKINSAKLKWYHEHKCVPHGYVSAASAPRRIYLCNDGLEYIWADIPEGK